jgi:hypothetical protein
MKQLPGCVGEIEEHLAVLLKQVTVVGANDELRKGSMTGRRCGVNGKGS